MDVRTLEAVRYLGYGAHAADDHTLMMIGDSFAELERTAQKRIVSRIFELETDGEKETLTMGGMQVDSSNLYKNMRGCHQVIVLGATLGVKVDQLIRTYSLTEMAKAVVMQACAAAYLEEYLDMWQTETARELKEDGLYLRPRFSPGYGDFSIRHQEEILRMLDAPKKIGLTMTDGSMLTPAKSVTAVIGLSQTERPCHIKGCEACKTTDCIYRR